MLINKQLRSYFGFVKTYPREMTILVISLCGSAFAVLFLGFEVKNFMESDLMSSSWYEITFKFAEVITLCVFLCFFIFLRSKTIADISDKIQNDIEQKIFDELIYFSYDYYSNHSPISVANKYRKEVFFIRKAIEVFYSFFLRNLLLVIGGIIMLFYSSWQLACFLFVILPCVIFPSVFLVKKLKKSHSKFKKKENALISFREEMLEAFSMIQSFNKQQNVSDLSEKKSDDLKIDISKKNFYRSFYISILILIVSVSIISILWFGVNQVRHGNLDAGSFASFLYFSVIVGAAFAGMSEVFADLSKANKAATEISDIMGNKKKFFAEVIDRLEKEFISFKNVCYAKSGKVILENVSFNIRKGEHISISGSSGQGKTTIVNLLLGLIKPDAGEIICSSKEVSEENLFFIRKNISYIQQEPKLFSGTIKDNLLFINPNASEEDIVRVLELVNLSKEIAQFPGGVKYHIGAKGSKLSTGQKQRLAIAMALIKFPEILILDEYASNLDLDNDEVITQKLKSFMKGKTIISISHNPQSQSNSDKILKIQDSVLKVIR